MKRFGVKAGMFSCIVAGSLVSIAALGGIRTFVPVQIDDSVSIARGAIGSAYNTTDRSQFIGCQTSGDEFGAAGWCEAKDSNGVFRSCVTTSANMIATMRSITSDSYLFFTWDTTGACTAVTVSNSSSNEIKQP